MGVIGLGNAYGGVFSNVTYAGAPGAAQPGADTTKTEKGATTAPNNSVIVTLSGSAKLVSAQESFKDVGMAARAKLDALLQQAAKETGVRASEVNIQRDTEISDYASVSDQELAAINLNTSGNFSKEEQVRANALLGERMRVSLEPYRSLTELGDRRGHAMAINALHDKMTPEVRRALSWDTAMMVSNNSMLDGDEKKFGKLDIFGIFANLRLAQAQGGLTFGTTTTSPPPSTPHQ